MMLLYYIFVVVKEIKKIKKRYSVLLSNDLVLCQKLKI